MDDRATSGPVHGGARRYWAERYGLAETEVVDLSTGINPHGWVVPPLPETVWQRLPEPSPALIEAAANYYGTDALLPVAGSQAAIQLLPQLRPHSRVGVLAPAYHEHQKGWQDAGHSVVALDADAIESELPQLDVLVVVNPNNPSAVRFSSAELLNWHQQLSDRGGWLIVDEAFMDTTPEQSLCRQGEPRSGLIILRSIGKFFGLAGIRVGFVCATVPLLQRLEARLGPWAVSHPAQWVAEQALNDQRWQQQMRFTLADAGARLQKLLTEQGLKPTGGTALFQWVTTPHAAQIMDGLAQQGVLVRHFREPASLRFGLPGDEAVWAHLQQALQRCELLRRVV